MSLPKLCLRSLSHVSRAALSFKTSNFLVEQLGGFVPFSLSTNSSVKQQL